MPGPTFQSKPFIKSSAANANSFAARYRGSLNKHPFLLFGLPFITTMVAGSFFLTPATALRYERHDRKVKQVSREEAMGLGKDRRKIDMREEYYVSAPKYNVWMALTEWTLIFFSQRLATKDIDDWEQKRVKRLPGEHEGIL